MAAALMQALLGVAWLVLIVYAGGLGDAGEQSLRGSSGALNYLLGFPGAVAALASAVLALPIALTGASHHARPVTISLLTATLFAVLWSAAFFGVI